MIPGFLIGLLVKFTHQLFKEITHLKVGETGGREVDQRAAKLLDDEKKPVAVVQLLDFIFKLELFKDVAGAR